MSQEMQKNYNPLESEQKWYKFWEEHKLFTPDPKHSPAFTIVIPPPNITGSLHMGHALDNSLQDVLIRYKRMQGFRTLWLPGTDHAGIATQNVVEKALKKEGKRKEDLGREKFLEKVWEWKKEYGGRITSQLRRLGASCDWSRERFTMDEGLSRAVRREFVELYREGLIYRGKRIINWCPRCKTALSDIEVEHQTQKGKLWYIRYGDVTVATTRPETMLGDTAVAVNPHDERFKHLHGKSVTLPLVGRRIPIIKDDFVDPQFGTGAVKVTPAHDPNDYAMGERHNLPKINIFTPDAKISLTEFEDKERERVRGLEGMSREKAREQIIKLLQEGGFLEKIEDHENAVGQCYRCKQIVEPYLSDQWFVKVRPLAEEAIRAVEDGKIKFVPERWTKVYLQWMTNLKDWCISRQLWWGHQIPVWYCKSEIRNASTGSASRAQSRDSKFETNPKLQIQNSKQESICNEIIITEDKPEMCPRCGGTDLKQDPDVFDTWFSSALWPFSTLGWPDPTPDLKTYYPTSVLVTGYDIITFWVSRMIMTGLHFMKKEPFKTVFIHGLVRDISGKKMSKSLGNVIDPLDVIEHAGADALRFALVSLVVGQGQDVKLTEDKISEARGFVIKIWNAARFVLMQEAKSGKTAAENTVFDRWIISRYNKTVKEVSELLDAFEIGAASQRLYQFIWSDFCDWYIEFSKLSPNFKVLEQIILGSLKLLHPFMPFMTEEINCRLRGGEGGALEYRSIMIQTWPKADAALIDDKLENEMGTFMEVVVALRRIRAKHHIPYSTEISGVIVSEEKFDIPTIKRIIRASSLEVVSRLKEEIPHAAAEQTPKAKIFIRL